MLAFQEFIYCFRKQFIFQNGAGANQNGAFKKHPFKRPCRYYTAFNQEQKIDTDLWGMMVFVYTGSLYRFTDKQMRTELHITKVLYDEIKKDAWALVSPKHPDSLLRQKVISKIQLIKNVLLVLHKVRPTFTF